MNSMWMHLNVKQSSGRRLHRVDRTHGSRLAGNTDIAE